MKPCIDPARIPERKKDEACLILDKVVRKYYESEKNREEYRRWKEERKKKPNDLEPQR